MQQPAPQQIELDKSQGQVPLNQPIMAMPVTGQPVMAAPATGQPIMYQMPPGQPQPMFVQALPGQPAMSPQGQPIQYYIPVGGQPVQQGQQAQLVQPVQVQGLPGQPQPSQDPDMAPIRINKAYLKSGLGVSRVGEFFCLLVAGIVIIIYSNRTFNLDGRANFFKGTIIFCWVMVIICEIIYMFGLNKSKNCFGQPSNFTIISIAFQVLLTILLISCTASLTVRATQFSHWFNSDYNFSSYYKDVANEQRLNAYLIYISLAFGYVACLDFLYDIRYLVIMYRQERSQEAGGTSQPAQQPGIIQQQQIGVVAQPPIQPQATQQGTQQVADNSQL